MSEELAALTRALEANAEANPHAPIALGRSTTFQGQHVQALVMMKPCRRVPIAQVLILASTPEAAAIEATRFVRALVKPEAEPEESVADGGT